VPVEDEKSAQPSEAAGIVGCARGAGAWAGTEVCAVVVVAGDAHAFDAPAHGSMLTVPLILLPLFTVVCAGCAGLDDAEILKGESLWLTELFCATGAAFEGAGAEKSNKSFMPLVELVCAGAGAPQLGLAALAKSPKPLDALAYAGRDVAVVVCAGFGTGFVSKKLPPLSAELCCGFIAALGANRCCCCCCRRGGLARFEKTAGFAIGGPPPKLSPLNASFMDPKFEDDCAAVEAGFADG